MLMRRRTLRSTRLRTVLDTPPSVPQSKLRHARWEEPRRRDFAQPCTPPICVGSADV